MTNRPPANRTSVAVISWIVLTASIAIANAQSLRSRSDLPQPLRDIAKDRPVDASCNELAGDATAASLQTQNRARNNFSTTGTPLTVNWGVFGRLQDAAERQSIPSGGNNGLPIDRSSLRNLITHLGTAVGEGTLVRLTALVLDASPVNVANGDSANCSKAGPENNDIRVSLGRRVDDDPCSSLIATISPHFRPDTWNSIGDYDFRNHPLRLTGPLFFDASHRPCRPGSRARPARMSIWEIHPVYAIDVCRFTILSKCRASEEPPWQPLHEWAGEQQ